MVNFWTLLGILVGAFILIFSIIAWCVYKWREIKDFFYSKTPFWRRNYFKVWFVHQNGQMSWQPLLINNKNQFEHSGALYDFDEEAVRFEKNCPVIYYFHNDPKAVRFNRVKVTNTDVQLDGTTYRQTMKAKLIRDLVKESQQMMIIIMILAGIGILIAVYIIYEMGFLDDFIKPRGVVS